MQKESNSSLGLLERGAVSIGIDLTSGQLDQFQTYHSELIAWNRKVNLTAITKYEDVQIKHFLDSLTVSLALPKPLPAELKMLDVGAGAGFPGLPLKILYPGIFLTLLEATGKKAAFLQHLAGVLGLEKVTILAQRAEEAAHLPEHREKYDIVVSRAVAEMSSLMELTLPFCRLGGRVISQKKGDIEEELRQSSRALRLFGGQLAELKEVFLPGASGRRILVVVTKVSSTPELYPRRSGIPVKKPII